MQQHTNSQASELSQNSTTDSYVQLMPSVQRFSEVVDNLVENDVFGNLARDFLKNY